MSPKKPRPVNDGQHDSDTKVLLAQGLSMQKAELISAIVFIGMVFTDLRPSEVMESIHATPEPV